MGDNGHRVATRRSQISSLQSLGGITGLAYCGNEVGLGEREKPANPFGNGRKRRHC